MTIVAQEAIGNNASSTNDVTVTNDALEGQFQLGFYTYNDNVATPVTMGTLDTKLDEFDDGAGEDTAFALAYEFVPSSPPASHTFSGSDGAPGGTSRVAGILAAFTGVDGTTPFDVTYVRANHYAKRVNDSSPACPTITTATNGAMVVVFAFTNNNDVTDMGELVGYTKQTETIGNDRNVAMFTRVVPTAGVEDPGELLPTGITASDETVIVVVALKPGAAAPFTIASVGVDDENVIVDNEIGVEIDAVAGGFGASQGSGFVQLADYNPAVGGSGTVVNQTETEWTDTKITFTADIGALSAGPAFVYVEEDGGAGQGFSVTLVADDAGDPVVRYTPVNVDLAQGVPVTIDCSGCFFHANIQDELTFGATGMPAGMSMSPQGVYSGSPAEGSNASSPYTVTVTATDKEGNSVNDQFTQTIEDDDPDFPATDASFDDKLDFLQWRKRRWLRHHRQRQRQRRR